MNALRLLALASPLLAAPSSAQHLVYAVEKEPDGIFTFPPQNDFGVEIAAIGDLDGDGRRDLLTLTERRTGGVYDSVVAISSADGSKLYTVPAYGGEYPAHPVVAIGDLTGDGVDDWALATYGPTQPTLTLQSKVKLRSGVDGSTFRVLTPPAPSIYFGSALAAIGDINGDGIEEMLVVDAVVNRETLNMGEAYVYSGLDGSLLRTHTGYSTQEWVAVDPNYGDFNRPTAAEGLDDVDGDGVRDYLVTSPRGRDTRGVVHVFSGATGGLIYEIVGTSTHFFLGLGWEVTKLGDVDSDGVGDFLVSSPQGNGWNNAYSAYSGADGSLLYTIDDKLQFVRVSEEVSDWDFDGRDDLFIASETTIFVHDTIDGSLRQIIDQSDLGNRLMWSVEAGIDLDLDGQGDLALALRAESAAPYAPASVSLYTKLDFRGAVHCTGATPASGCACGNTAGPQTGCANSTGSGGGLRQLTPAQRPQDMELICDQLPPGTPALLFSGLARQPAGASSLLGDGALCIEGPLQRVAIATTNAQGVHEFPSGLDQLTGWQPGEERNFQVWYRDTSGPCGTGSNVTNAYRVYWLP